MKLGITQTQTHAQKKMDKKKHVGTVISHRAGLRAGVARKDLLDGCGSNSKV